MTDSVDPTAPPVTLPLLEADAVALENASTAYGDARAKLTASAGALADATAKGAGLVASAQQQANDLVAAAQKTATDGVSAAQAVVDADTAAADVAHQAQRDLIAKIIADAKATDPAPVAP